MNIYNGKYTEISCEDSTLEITESNYKMYVNKIGIIMEEQGKTIIKNNILFLKTKEYTENGIIPEDVNIFLDKETYWGTFYEDKIIKKIDKYKMKNNEFKIKNQNDNYILKNGLCTKKIKTSLFHTLSKLEGTYIM